MQSCTASEFVRRWPGSLRRTVVPKPRPALPESSLQLLTEFGLPSALTICCYNNMILRFSGSATPLAVIWERDLNRGFTLGEMPPEWIRYWHLADQHYTQGSGWICIEEISGRLVVIDLDLPDPVYLLNSGMDTFYTTLAHFIEWSETMGGSPVETLRLRDALRTQDCIPPEELEPFWLNFVDATIESDPKNVSVTLGAENADLGGVPDRQGP